MLIQQVPALAVAGWAFRAPVRLHGLPDEIVMTSLADTLCDLYNERWAVCVAFSDGRGVFAPGPSGAPDVPEPVREKMQAVAIEANRSIHHDGHWLVVWTTRATIGMVWRDADGDAQVAVDFDDPWERIGGWPVSELCQRAEAAYHGARERLRMVEVRPHEKIKRAQGEKPRGRR